MNQTTVNSTPHTLHTTDVTAALDAILNTDKFAASPQMSAFLRYVVEQTLIGNTRRIKAFTVGIEALGKPASFDPQTDPSVRVLAKRLRSSLDTYYLQNPDTLVYIEMKPGSYIPKFLLRSDMENPMPAVPHASNTSQSNGSVAQQGGERLIDRAVSPNHTAYLSVTQKQEMENQAATNGAIEKSGDAQSSQGSNISQLWQAYKAASKVA